MKGHTQERGRTVSGNEDCKHWWMIDTPAGPVSNARCKFCGKERTFDTPYGYAEGFEKMIIQPSDALTQLPFEVMR